MAFDLILILTETGLLGLLALIVGVALFPLALVMSFVYDALTKKFSKTPKFLILLICGIIGAFIALIILELYVGNSLQQLLSIQCS